MRWSRRDFLTFFTRLLPANLLAGSLATRAAEASAVQSPHHVAAADDGDGALRFLVLGDWGRDGKHHQRDLARQMGRVAEERRCRFVISTGDNFYEDGVVSADDPQWRTSFEDVYTAASLQVPWYATLGNHDYHARPQAEVEYAKRSKRWRLPARYYAAAEGCGGGDTVRFFFLDTSPFVDEYRWAPKMAGEVRSQDTDAQLRWLDAALAASDDRWQIVVGHHPVYSGGEHGNQPELEARLLPILERRGVGVYLNGHDHNLQHIARDGRHFFTSGAGSLVSGVRAIEGTKFAQDNPGFLVVTLNREVFRGEFIGLNGATLYAVEVAHRALATA